MSNNESNIECSLCEGLGDCINPHSSYNLLSGLETQLEVQDYFSRGHANEVNCVAASEDCEYIVSGGTDCTTRVWKYEKEDTSSYHVCLVVSHVEPSQTPVTAVDCFGKSGPALSCTSDGSLFIVELADHHLSRVKVHEKEINDICTRAYADGYLLIATASADQKVKLHTLHDDSDKTPRGKHSEKKRFSSSAGVRLSQVKDASNTSQGFSFNTIRTISEMPHDKTVLQVRYISVKDQDACFATCTPDSVHIWKVDFGLHGEKASLIQQIKPSMGGHVIQGFTVSHEGNFVLLAERSKRKGEESPREDHQTATYADTSSTSARESRTYELLEPRVERNASSHLSLSLGSEGGIVSVWGLEGGKASEKPLAQYVHKVKSLDWEPKGQFVVHQRDVHTCVLWSIFPEGKAPTSGSSKLVESGEEHIELDWSHSHEIRKIQVIQDPEDGPCLLAGTRNGSVIVWDLQGEDAGERVAELRSLGRTELLIPVFMLMVTFLQVSSFAFGPTIPWEEEVRIPVEYTIEIVMLDFEIAFNIDRELIFWPKIFVVLGLIVFFSFSALFALPQFVDKSTRRIMHTSEWKQERRDGRTCGPKHCGVSFWKCLKTIVRVVMGVCATILVVPMFKACATAIDCVHTEDGKAHLAVAPSVECYVGSQKTLSIVLAIVCPLYFVLLMPYALVGGDVNYVQRKELFSPRLWRMNAERKASVIYLGPVHPLKENFFITQLLELLAKVFLPCVVIETTSKPILQMSCVSAAGLVMLVSSILYPPLVDPKFCTIVRSLRLFTLCAMVCGLLTVVVDEDHRNVPTILFGSSIILVFCIAMIQLKCRKHAVNNKYDNVVQKTAGDSHALDHVDHLIQIDH